MKLTSKEMVELESFVSEDLVKGDSYMHDFVTWKLHKHESFVLFQYCLLENFMGLPHCGTTH